MTRRVTVADLVAFPKRAAAAAERERAKRNAPGFHGMARRLNPQAKLFEDTTEVEVFQRSPALKAGIHTGDLVIAISVPEFGFNQILFDHFHEHAFPAGTRIGVELFRPTAGGRHRRLSFAITLAPCPRGRQWELQPRESAGLRVKKKERPIFLATMLGRKGAQGYEPGYLFHRIPAHETRVLAFAYLATLLLLFDNDKNRGVWPSHETVAGLLGVVSRWTYELQRMLVWFGVLRLVERRGAKRSNTYEITWPLPAAQQHSSHQPAPSTQGGGVRRVRC
ncbi:MAG: hypothetical protein ABSF87_14070 [Xanthobacteraceae bacterium]|jgi:hypothetical protein